MFSGPCPVRTLEASSQKAVSRTKQRRFRMIHCEGMIFASRWRGGLLTAHDACDLGRVREVEVADGEARTRTCGWAAPIGVRARDWTVRLRHRRDSALGGHHSRCRGHAQGSRRLSALRAKASSA
jgi:hypothetical protein